MEVLNLLHKGKSSFGHAQEALSQRDLLQVSVSNWMESQAALPLPKCTRWINSRQGPNFPLRWTALNSTPLFMSFSPPLPHVTNHSGDNYRQGLFIACQAFSKEECWLFSTTHAVWYKYRYWLNYPRAGSYNRNVDICRQKHRKLNLLPPPPPQLQLPPLPPAQEKQVR